MIVVMCECLRVFVCVFMMLVIWFGLFSVTFSLVCDCGMCLLLGGMFAVCLSFLRLLWWVCW